MPTNQHTTGTGGGRRDVPLVRLLPVPDTDPAPLLHPGQVLAPGGAAAAGAGQLVLALSTGVGTPRWAEPADVDPVVTARPSVDADLPDPTKTCQALAAAVVEVLSGRRPVTQLTRWTTHDVHTELARRAALVTRLHPTAPQGRGQRPAVVRRVRITHPADGVVEAAAVVLDTHRIRAVALRLEGWDTRWRLTALEVG